MTTTTEQAQEKFTEYFVKNYPGPDTIIHDPKWHAPRIFRAALAALAATQSAQEPAIKDHLIAQAINELRYIAVKFHATQQLRERIARIAAPLARGNAAELEREIAAARMVPAQSAQPQEPIGYLDRFNVFYPTKHPQLEMRAVYAAPVAQASAPAQAAEGLAKHEPTIAIDEILAEYSDEDREDIWESIQAYAEIYARRCALAASNPQAAQQAREPSKDELTNEERIVDLAIKHRLRYPTNQALLAFVAALSAQPTAQDSAQGEKKA